MEKEERRKDGESAGTVHEPVLLHEIIEALTGKFEILNSKSEHASVPVPWYIDGTLGGAGHALAIAATLKGKLNILGFDRDPAAIERATRTLQGKATKVILENEDYRDLDRVMDAHGIKKADMMLLDLGISSDELESSGRGFTFLRSEPLLMTLGEPADYPFTAKDIVNGWDEDVIANIIFGYAEERFARRIAKAIAIYRTKARIETSSDLAEIVKSAVPPFARRGKIHPATKTFQALRIAVNDELNALREGLKKGYARLSAGGRMAVISFHSLEDRIVKDFYKEKAAEGGRILTKKPIAPTEQEKAENPRSRSAKLRTIEKPR